MANKDYFFDDITDLIGYMKSKYKYISPLKLQKGLYFLFAYYTQFYGNKVQMAEEISEEDFSNYPKYLFNKEFEAWRYGPVITEVYFKNRDDDYTSEYNEKVFESIEGQEIKLFIDDLLDDLMTTSDFNLVDRSHEDKSWIEAYESGGGNGIMFKENIAADYSKGK